jgi:hypothetical protein
MPRRKSPPHNGTSLSHRLTVTRLENGQEAYHYSENGGNVMVHVFPLYGFIPRRIQTLVNKALSHVRTH